MPQRGKVAKGVSAIQESDVWAVNSKFLPQRNGTSCAKIKARHASTHEIYDPCAKTVYGIHVKLNMWKGKTKFRNLTPQQLQGFTVCIHFSTHVNEHVQA